MKRVDAREFQEHAEEYLAGDELLEIECDGRPVGHYLPVQLGWKVDVRRDTETVTRQIQDTVRSQRKLKAREAVERLEQTVRRVLDETGLTEDELADLFDLSKPLPDGPIGRQKTTV